MAVNGVDAALIALAALLLGAAPAPARGASDPCEDEAQLTECYARHQQELLAPFGLQPAEAHLAAGEEMNRAMFRDGYSRLVVALVFLRRPGQEPMLYVYRPVARPGSPGTPALAIALHASDWGQVRDSSLLFDRVLQPPSPRTEGGIVVCPHAWLFVVEATDPRSGEEGRPLRRRAESACDDGVTEQYAMSLAALAVRALPACAALEGGRFRNDPDRLTVCAGFEGDRIAAAEVFPLFDDLRYANRRDDAGPIRRLFAFRATVEWAGLHFPDGTGGAAAWLAGMEQAGGSLAFTGATGEDASRVRIRAVMRRWEERAAAADAGDGIWMHAPVEFLWVRHPHTGWAVEHVTVGAAVPAPSFCAPGLLTGAEQANICHW